jgi:hypothetical protein
MWSRLVRGQGFRRVQGYVLMFGPDAKWWIVSLARCHRNSRDCDRVKWACLTEKGERKGGSGQA